MANISPIAGQDSLKIEKPRNFPATFVNGSPQPLNPLAQTQELLDKIGPAYRLGGQLPEAAAAQATLSKEEELREEKTSEAEIAQMKRTGEIECATCKSRVYVDGSADPGVSFKAPGHVSAEASYAAVASHENEHVSNEQSRADKDGRKVVSQSVQVFMATCPECGKAYAAGGVTKTTTAAASHHETGSKENEKI
jgi:hypothetical protein